MAVKIKPTQPLSDIASRVRIIYDEWKGKDYHKGYKKFGELTKQSSTHVFDMLNGNREVSLDFVNTVCDVLGYNLEWVSFGTGPMKKNKKDRAKIHDLVKIMQDNEVLRNEINRIKARMAGIEREVEELKGDKSLTNY